MAENVYEGMFLLDTNRYGQDSEAVAGQIPEMIEKAGGQVLVSRLWEERRLAYPVKGHRKGTYWLTYFRIDSSQLADLQRQSHLSESIFRVLFLKVDPRIVDALVAHALTGHAGAAREDKDQDGTAKDAVPAQAVAVADSEELDPEKLDSEELDHSDPDDEGE